jgi:hypothetical protein
MMSDLVLEIRRLRRENKKLLEHMTELQGQLALLVLEKAALQKKFDELQSTSDIFRGIFGKAK